MRGTVLAQSRIWLLICPWDHNNFFVALAFSAKLVWSTLWSFCLVKAEPSKNLGNIENILQEYNLWSGKIEQGAAGWEARTLPLCYAAQNILKTDLWTVYLEALPIISRKEASLTWEWFRPWRGSSSWTSPSCRAWPSWARASGTRAWRSAQPPKPAELASVISWIEEKGFVLKVGSITLDWIGENDWIMLMLTVN